MVIVMAMVTVIVMVMVILMVMMMVIGIGVVMVIGMAGSTSGACQENHAGMPYSYDEASRTRAARV